MPFAIATKAPSQRGAYLPIRKVWRI